MRVNENFNLIVLIWIALPSPSNFLTILFTFTQPIVIFMHISSINRRKIEKNVWEQLRRPYYHPHFGGEYEHIHSTRVLSSLWAASRQMKVIYNKINFLFFTVRVELIFILYFLRFDEGLQTLSREPNELVAMYKFHPDKI